ncbi:hypothetical protein [Ideonella oryzae]|uniref:Molecular chaperone DnaJ n=1 Tax=Ideonella oryzae TaxID=2937441 RepID=A0ABT1BKB8_9BURK|nr:hypothetical protein [Ideonella oryzae]MCO5976652.1 hypothetical protein [Ideonella oryzae]
MDTAPSGQPPLLRRNKVIWLLSAIALLVLVVWVSRSVARSSPAPAAATGQTLSKPPVHPASSLSWGSAAPGAGQSAEASVPDGLTAQEWAQVQPALASDPDAASELQRIGRWLSFQRRGQRFQEALHRQDHGPETQALARRIDAEIDTHLALGELSGPEALALKSAVLGELEPDTPTRAQTLRQWRETQIDRHPPAADPRDAAYATAQAEIVARWRSQSGESPNSDALRAQLIQARARVYGPSAPAP